jgi:hypothetical protein
MNDHTDTRMIICLYNALTSADPCVRLPAAHTAEGRPGRMPLTGHQRQNDLGRAGRTLIGAGVSVDWWRRLGIGQRRWRGCARGR